MVRMEGQKRILGQVVKSKTTVQCFNLRLLYQAEFPEQSPITFSQFLCYHNNTRYIVNPNNPQVSTWLKLIVILATIGE